MGHRRHREGTCHSPASTTYQGKPGGFRLEAVNVVTGHVVFDQALPAFYGGSDGVVTSADTPPGVVGVCRGMVLVSPEQYETGIIETFERH